MSSDMEFWYFILFVVIIYVWFEISEYMINGRD